MRSRFRFLILTFRCFHCLNLWRICEVLHQSSGIKFSRSMIVSGITDSRQSLISFMIFRFWEYSSTRKLINSGNIGSYGLPLTLANMDAVFTWEGNNKTYFFKGKQVLEIWRWNRPNSEVLLWQKVWKIFIPKGYQNCVEILRKCQGSGQMDQWQKLCVLE